MRKRATRVKRMLKEVAAELGLSDALAAVTRSSIRLR
jgi:hypothetical protein